MDFFKRNVHLVAYSRVECSLLFLPNSVTSLGFNCEMSADDVKIYKNIVNPEDASASN